MHPDKIAEEIARGTSVILTSNPRNPTGQVLTNPELAQIQDICKLSEHILERANTNRVFYRQRSCNPDHG
jgi:aspartate/methionine/tyrosine aminotransferase